MTKDNEKYQAYVQILNEELIPAMGCTEPIALAYAAAKAREVLGCLPDRVCIGASGSIIKNVKSVIVPNTNHLKGIPAAAAAGIVAGNAEKELKSLEDRREQLQPIMDSVSKEIKEYGTVKTLLPEAGTLERAVTYRDKKIKPLFIQLKNKVAAMVAQVKELTKEVEGWKRKYQKVKQKYNAIQRELDDIRKDNQKLSEEKDILQGVSDRYDRVVRVLGIETVDTAVQQDIQNEKVLEEKRRMEQMPKGNIHERLAWGMKKSEMENQQRKKTKSKNREMER